MYSVGAATMLMQNLMQLIRYTETSYPVIHLINNIIIMSCDIHLEKQKPNNNSPKPSIWLQNNPIKFPYIRSFNSKADIRVTLENCLRSVNPCYINDLQYTYVYYSYIAISGDADMVAIFDSPLIRRVANIKLFYSI